MEVPNGGRMKVPGTSGVAYGDASCRSRRLLLLGCWKSCWSLVLWARSATLARLMSRLRVSLAVENLSFPDRTIRIDL